MNPSVDFIHKLMGLALEQAQLASRCGEVPVGAAIAREEEILAVAHNLTETRHDPTAHAERLVIEAAANKTRNWRLADSILAVTLEPCTMCVGAIKLARIPVVVFGASDPKAGAAGSLYNVLADDRTGASPRLISGVNAQESVALLQQFFEARRKVNR